MSLLFILLRTRVKHGWWLWSTIVVFERNCTDPPVNQPFENPRWMLATINIICGTQVDGNQIMHGPRDELTECPDKDRDDTKTCSGVAVSKSHVRCPVQSQVRKHCWLPWASILPDTAWLIYFWTLESHGIKQKGEYTGFHRPPSWAP